MRRREGGREGERGAGEGFEETNGIIVVKL
jgi:hypothetical protein